MDLVDDAPPVVPVVCAIRDDDRRMPKHHKPSYNSTHRRRSWLAYSTTMPTMMTTML
jgi:hypothetical protein